jgi:outer membrane protein OmpA-like peptidoglycan-associated protein
MTRALLEAAGPRVPHVERPEAGRSAQRPPAAALLCLQRSVGNAAVARTLARRRPAVGAPPQTAVQRCGPTPCDCSAEERAEHTASSADELTPVQALNDPGAPAVQRQAGGETTPIGELSTEDSIAGTGGPSAAGQQTGGGTVEDANGRPTAQRQTAPTGPVVVQRMTREEEINLSLTSPGRAVLDPSRPSLSLFNFGIDRPEPKAYHVALLAEFAAFLRQEVTAPTRIQVVGHADPTGTAPHNQTLSGQRAEAVAAAVVVAQGSAVQTSAEGDSHPVASNSTVDGRSRNRRVDILVTATGPPKPPDPNRPRGRTTRTAASATATPGSATSLRRRARSPSPGRCSACSFRSSAPSFCA